MLGTCVTTLASTCKQLGHAKGRRSVRHHFVLEHTSATISNERHRITDPLAKTCKNHQKPHRPYDAASSRHIATSSDKSGTPAQAPLRTQLVAGPPAKAPTWPLGCKCHSFHFLQVHEHNKMHIGVRSTKLSNVTAT